MSDDGQDDDRREPTHPKFSKRQDAAQRGEDPPDSVGEPSTPDFPEENPGWEPDPRVADPWRKLISQYGGEHRPNREDVLPYLLIRAFAPGDRAKRPIWPPQPSWLSPDILLIPASWSGAFRADKVVASPTAGRTYRVFVHVWNLGLLAAAGVHVRAWHVNPGFFGGTPGTYTPELIGGAFVDLEPRGVQGAHRVVEMLPPWPIPTNLTGHECLLAAADCPADRWDGVLDANADRHVGQRNLTIMAGSEDLAPLLVLLGGMLADRDVLEVTVEGRGALRYGVPIKGGQHLFVATKQGDRLLVVPTVQLGELVGDRLPDLSEPGTASHLFGRWARRYGDGLEAGSLDQALGKLLDVPDLRAERVITALGAEGTQTLHLASFNVEGRPLGGYSIGVVPRADPKR
jgi:hypothetical protein